MITARYKHTKQESFLTTMWTMFKCRWNNVEMHYFPLGFIAYVRVYDNGIKAIRFDGGSYSIDDKYWERVK